MKQLARLTLIITISVCPPFVSESSRADVTPSSPLSVWVAEGNQVNASFGYSVATAGDVNGDGYSDVVVGAYLHDAGETDEGRAYLFLGSASGFVLSHAWTTEGNQTEAGYGFSVAPAGDVNGDGFFDVLVGAFLYDDEYDNEGRAYLYLGSPLGMSLAPSWTAGGDQAGARFGYSVAGAGDVNNDGFADVIVGADRFNGGESNEGRAFLYLGSPSGLLAAPAWTAEADQEDARFGASLCTAGDVIGDGFPDVIVGAPRYENGELNEGRSFVYLGSASGLNLTSAWTAESDQSNALFGIAVSTAGDFNSDGYADVLIGATQYDNGEGNEGRTSLYLGSASGLEESASFSVEANQPNAFCGRSVATAGDLNGDGFSELIVGMPLFDQGQTNEGAVSVHVGSGSNPSDQYDWAFGWPSYEFGYSVATAGDVNGDGYSDLIVGSPCMDILTCEDITGGIVYAFYGSASGLDTSWSWYVHEGDSLSFFGYSVSSAGDVNGDGFSDVIAGRPWGGRAYIYMGSASGLHTTYGWLGSEPAHFFGQSVATAGDVNRDGFSDVIVGSPYEHRAYLYLGSVSGPGTLADWQGEGSAVNGGFGSATSSAGDVNGDGYSDIIVGAPCNGCSGLDRGQAQVFLGSPSGVDLLPHWTTETDQNDARFGTAVETAGDINGDGFSDVIVGAPLYDNGESDEGRAYVYLGSASGLSTVPSWTGESDQVEANYGNSVSTAGDPNGDGYSDILVGAKSFDNEWSQQGRAFLYLGSASGLSLSPYWIADGTVDFRFLGVSTALAGDVNGDGFSDLVVGAGVENHDPDVAFVYHGNEGGLDRIPRQARANDSGLIEVLGMSDSNTSFRLKARGRTPSGRGEVALEWEAKLLGVPFDETGWNRGSFQDTGFPDALGSYVELNRLVQGLTPNTSYRWRLRVITKNPLFPCSRWFTVPYNSPTETDLRTGSTLDQASDFVLDYQEPGGSTP